MEAEELMANFLAEHGLCVRLEDLGIEEAQIPELVKNIHGDLSADPISGEAGICEGLYRESLAGG